MGEREGERERERERERGMQVSEKHAQMIQSKFSFSFFVLSVLAYHVDEREASAV